MEIIQLITDIDWNILDERFTGSKASGEVYINIFSKTQKQHFKMLCTHEDIWMGFDSRFDFYIRSFGILA